MPANYRELNSVLKTEVCLQEEQTQGLNMCCRVNGGIQIDVEWIKPQIIPQSDMGKLDCDAVKVRLTKCKLRTCFKS